VPDQYRDLYEQLDSNIENLVRQDGAGSVLPAPSGGTVMAAALSTADGNRGTALLDPSTLPLINTELDRFRELGLNGVMLEMGYPLLLPTFPNSPAYLAFYTVVAAAVHARDMALSVEVNPVFPDPQVSSLNPDYSGLTTASYAAGQQQEAQLVIDNMHPQYLDILDEPSTFAGNLGLKFDTPTGVAHLLGLELTGLNKGSTLVGAGIVDFEDPGLERAIAGVPGVDFLSVHVYPTGPDQLAVLNETTQIAAQAHLPLVMDETWLSKVNVAGKATKGQPEIEARLKTYSFWAPLDSSYLAAITTYARMHGISLVSPFSSDQFFSYLDWSTTVDGEALNAVRAQEAATEKQNIADDQFTATAQAYRQAVAGRT